MEWNSELLSSVQVLTKEDRQVTESTIRMSGCVPDAGYEFKPGQLKEAGNYLLGPVLGSSPVKSMVHCLGRKKGTDEFFTLKILTVKEGKDETQDDRQGKMLLHTEHSLLSFLDGQSGILKQHGLFQDYACDAEPKPDSRVLVGTGKLIRRICLVLDCVYPHDYNPYSTNYINLQHYVISKRKLIELDAFTIFYNIVSVIHRLHELNVIHRDIKLANLVLNQQNRQITLINFCLGQHLVSENDRLQDQRGSPAYISPDVLIGKPYLGKPSDMWALGVVLFTMLFGQFPFYHRFHQELFKMIKSASYTIPSDSEVKSDTLDIIRGLLLLDPSKRLTSHQVLVKLTTIITGRLSLDNLLSHDLQVVPDIQISEEKWSDSNEQGNKKKIKSGTSIVSNESAVNDLDYMINRPLSYPSDGSQDKKLSAFPNSGTVSKNVPVVVNSNSNENSRSGNSISIIEGDIRSFTQVDLYLHRNIFPRYTGPELLRWRSSKERSTDSSIPADPLSRSVGRVTQSSALRMAASCSCLPSVDIPPFNGSQNMYEFPPHRRCALAILQQLNSDSENNARSVPQLDASADDAVPSFSGASDQVNISASKTAKSEKARKPSGGDDSTSSNSQESVAGGSGLNKGMHFGTDIEGRSSKKLMKMDNPSKCSSSSSVLARRRVRAKNLGKMLSKSPLFLKLCSDTNSISAGTIVEATSSSSSLSQTSTSEVTMSDISSNDAGTSDPIVLHVSEVDNIMDNLESRQSTTAADNGISSHSSSSDDTSNDESNSESMNIG